MSNFAPTKWEAQIKGNTKFERKLRADIFEDPNKREKTFLILGQKYWSASHGPILYEAQVKGNKKTFQLYGSKKSPLFPLLASLPSSPFSLLGLCTCSLLFHVCCFYTFWFKGTTQLHQQISFWACMASAIALNFLATVFSECCIEICERIPPSVSSLVQSFLVSFASSAPCQPFIFCPFSWMIHRRVLW